MSDRQTTSAQNTESSNDSPIVSVIIPAYNVAQYIGEALQSVFAQTFSDYEVIVINDGSPDTPHLEQALAPYLSRIVYLKQENRGLSGARNTGIRAARSSLIALLDADDVWEPEYLAVQVAEMQRDPTIDVLYPNALIFGDGQEAGRRFMELCPSEGEVTFERLVTQQCHVMVSVTMRLQSVVDAGMFDEGLRSSEDFDLWLRIVKRGGRIAYHRKVLVRYRRRPESLSADSIWMLKHVLQVLEKAARTLPLTDNEKAVVEQEKKRFRAGLRLEEGKQAFFDGDTQAAIEALREANAYFKSRKTVAVILLLRFAPRLMLRVYDFRDRFIFGAGTRI